MERCVLTVDGKKFANVWNENKRHLDIHSALHTQRYANPLAPMFNVGVYVQQAALRNLRCSHTLASYAVVLCQHWMWGGEGVLHRNVARRIAWMPFANFFPSTVPLNMVMHCTVVWTRGRYVCPYNTRPRVSGCALSSSSTFSCSNIHSSHAAAVQPKGRRIIAKPFPLEKQTNPTNPTNPDFTHAQKAD